MLKNAMNQAKNILVTGAAGFIGFHMCERLLQSGYAVTGFDNLNDYYDPQIKQARLQILGNHPHFTFVQGDLVNQKSVLDLFAKTNFEIVIHLAAQAGVRYSLTNPQAYVDSNITGFLSVLEACRAQHTKHLLFASSSSVYGLNQKQPYAEFHSTDHPISLYAASKKANEMMAHSYAHLFGLPVTGLRFFTVYGPWGRPDMALFKFTKAIFENKPLDVFNGGEMYRGFTYVDDIVEAMMRLMLKPPAPNAAVNMADPHPNQSPAPYCLYNIGSADAVYLKDMIAYLEEETGRKALINPLPMQPGDVPKTSSDVTNLQQATAYVPQITLREGVRRFVRWYKEYHQIGA